MADIGIGDDLEKAEDEFVKWVLCKDATDDATFAVYLCYRVQTRSLIIMSHRMAADLRRCLVSNNTLTQVIEFRHNTSKWKLLMKVMRRICLSSGGILDRLQKQGHSNLAELLFCGADCSVM